MLTNPCLAEVRSWHQPAQGVEAGECRNNEASGKAKGFKAEARRWVGVSYPVHPWPSLLSDISWTRPSMLDFCHSPRAPWPQSGLEPKSWAGRASPSTQSEAWLSDEHHPPSTLITTPPFPASIWTSQALHLPSTTQHPTPTICFIKLSQKYSPFSTYFRSF